MFEKFKNRWKGRLKKYSERYLLRPDMEGDADFQKIYQKVGTRQNKFTMTPMERCWALYGAVRYISKSGIEGDFVECGVWRGGSSMLSALTLISLNDLKKKIYLYDTFEGMPEPTDKDIDIQGVPYSKLWEKEKEILSVSLDEVKQNMLSTGYPENNISLIKGMVEDTLPETAPDNISLLRLDTDFHDSTYHELVHLYPRLSPGGVLIIDDYGHFKGARSATDQYFSETKQNILLNRVDYSCRIGIKVS